MPIEDVLRRISRLALKVGDIEAEVMLLEQILYNDCDDAEARQLFQKLLERLAFLEVLGRPENWE